MSIPPNRIAALGSVLAALAGAVVTLLGAVDTLPKALVMCVFILAVAAVAIVFLLGWQKHEAHVAEGKVTIDERQAISPPVTDPGPAPTTEDPPGEITGLTEGVKAVGPVEGSDG